jgi:hypothetical protein
VRVQFSRARFRGRVERVFARVKAVRAPGSV